MTDIPAGGATPLPAVAAEAAAIPPATTTNQAPADGAAPTEGEPTASAPAERRRRRKVALLIILAIAFVGLLLLAIWYLLFRQPITPLPGLPTNAIPTYSTSIAGPKHPLGVAVSEDGSRIYVGATEGDRIARIYDASGNEVGELQPPTSTGTSHVPVYLARDPQTNEVYVSDRPTGSIFIYDAAGNFLRQFTAPTSIKGWQPLGMAFDKAGNFYATNVGSNPQAVDEFDRSGNLVRTFGDAEALSFPNCVAVDGNGNVYVTDGNNGRLLVYGPDGTKLAQVGRGSGEGNLGLPRGVVVTSDGKVMVADATGQTVFVYQTYQNGDRDLKYLGSFGTEGIADGQFEYPNGLALDGRGRVYVVDSGNNRVQVWSY